MTRTIRLSLAILMTFATVSFAAMTPLIELGRAAISRADFDAAVEVLERAVVQSPKSAEAHYYLGSAYSGKIQQDGMLAAAKYGAKVKDEFEKAVALDPQQLDARYSLVQVYSAAPAIMGGSMDKALEQAMAIKAIDPFYGHRAYAFIYSQQKKLDLAKKEYLDAVREQPNAPKPHSFLGAYLVNVEKDYGAAFAEFDTALKCDPAYMPAFYHLGRTAALADTNLALGEQSLKKYLGYTPKDNEPMLANANYYLGAIYEKQGKAAEAKLSYQQALKLNPTLKLALEAMKRML
jgi:tetratricopeptide (TPR) repeat protein